MFQVKQLIELGKQYGTPLYVYSEDVIRSQYQRLSTALNGIPHQVCLAVKANSNPGNGKNTIVITTHSIQAQSIRLKIVPLLMIPEGRAGAGKAPWTFIDEISVY